MSGLFKYIFSLHSSESLPLGTKDCQSLFGTASKEFLVRVGLKSYVAAVDLYHERFLPYVTLCAIEKWGGGGRMRKRVNRWVAVCSSLKIVTADIAMGWKWSVYLTI